jgi:hypothetical protein
LGAPSRRFANAEYSTSGLRLFVGRYCEFEELQFANLRSVPGWNGESEAIRNQTSALACPQCGAPVLLRAAGFSVTAICGSCNTAINAATPELETIRISTARKAFEPLIPLGTRGRFRGTEFECIAFLRRTDGSGDTWSEYLLFNPFRGFRWLVTYNGHWSFVQSLLEPPDFSGDQPVFEAKPFKIFGRANAKVSYVIGEVYWKMRVQERTECEDYIHPPWVLSSEKYPDLKEVTWSVGEYIQPTEVAQAFQLPNALREPTGSYLNAPNPHQERGKSLRRWVPIFLGIALLIQLLTAGHAAKQVVLNKTFLIQPTSTNQVYLSDEFQIPGTRPQSLLLKTFSPLQNQWLELSVDLINTTSQEVEEFAQTLEYYSGWDEGSWSEGSQTEESILGAIKPGRYRLSIEPEWDKTGAPPSVEVELVRDVPIWSNFWISLTALLAYPFYRWYREHSFEQGRWANSDFSPYTLAESTEDSEDE